MSLLDEVHRLIEASYPAHLDSIREFLRMPSISADGTGIRETGEAVKGFIEELGGRAEIVPTAGQPAVYGELSLGKPKTLLVFSSYDVVPAEEEEWVVPPFSAEIVELPHLGRCLVSRGVYDTKAPLLGFLNAVRAIQEVDELPVNLKFVIEGGEEQGSKGFRSSSRSTRRDSLAMLPCCLSSVWTGEARRSRAWAPRASCLWSWCAREGSGEAPDPEVSTADTAPGSRLPCGGWCRRFPA